MGTSKKGEPLFINAHDSVIAVDSESVRVIISIIEALCKRADEAFKGSYYLESATIMFQVVENYLRIAVKILAQNNSVKEVIEKLKKETSLKHPYYFYTYVNFFQQVKPGNSLPKKLYDFNNTRNRFVHRLCFDFESIDSLENVLKDFYRESLELKESLKLFVQ
jgi:hypothetical protein